MGIIHRFHTFGGLEPTALDFVGANWVTVALAVMLAATGVDAIIRPEIADDLGAY